MSIEDQILIDLLAGQSTARSIAERLRSDHRKITVILTRMEREQLVSHGTIMNTIEVWHLDLEGRLRAQQAKPAPRVRERQTPPATPA